VAEPSRRRGKIAEHLLHRWCEDRGLQVKSSNSPEADLIIEGRKVKVKLSTIWETGVYKFQQIRKQDYDCIILLGLSPPQIVHCWLIPKNEAFDYAVPQHMGQRGSDTYWISFKPNTPPWGSRYGGTLEKVLEMMRKWRREKS